MLLQRLTTITFAFLFLFSLNTLAESDAFFASYPEGGTWYATDDSKTGFFFDVQNGSIAGAYFGFDNRGNPLWLSFNGQLQALFDLTAPDFQIGWQLETVLRRSVNGSCILNCASSISGEHAVSDVAPLFLRFEGRSRGSFGINGGSLTDIIPFSFGAPAIISELSEGLTSQPDLQGTWVAVAGTAQRDENNVVTLVNIAETTGIIEIGEQQTETPPATGTLEVLQVLLNTRAPVLQDTTGLLPPGNVEIVCEYTSTGIVEDDAQESKADCFVYTDIDTFAPADVLVTPIQFMSDSRFIINIRSPEDAGSITRIEAFRVDYD